MYKSNQIKIFWHENRPLYGVLVGGEGARSHPPAKTEGAPHRVSLIRWKDGRMGEGPWGRCASGPKREISSPPAQLVYESYPDKINVDTHLTKYDFRTVDVLIKFKLIKVWLMTAFGRIFVSKFTNIHH